MKFPLGILRQWIVQILTRKRCYYGLEVSAAFCISNYKQFSLEEDRERGTGQLSNQAFANRPLFVLSCQKISTSTRMFNAKCTQKIVVKLTLLDQNNLKFSQ